MKNSIVIKRIEPVEKETDRNGRTLEILKICLKLPSFDNFWIITVYNSPGKPLSTDKIFSGKLKNVFICGDFNAPHHELNCSYDSENGEKLLYIIDEGTFKLLNNGYHNYQSFDGKCKNMLDLHFCDNSLFAHFNNFQVSEDLGSDHKVTITTLNLRKGEVFQLKSKINYRKFREQARKLHRSSNLWPVKYPKKNELNKFSTSLIELIRKSLEDSCIKKKELPYSVETQKLIKMRRKRRRELKIAVGDHYTSLRTEINYLQKEIKRSMMRSEDRKRAKVLESACDKGSKGFWKAIKELTNKNEPKQKTAEYPKLFYKDCVAVTDKDKSEMFKQLLKDTMKNYETDSSIISELCDNIENETEAIINTNEHTEQLGIVVTTKEFDEILKETRKACPGPDKICYKILEELPKNVKALACLLISSSINNSFVPFNWKKSQIKMIPKQDKDRSKAENYRPISLTNCIAKICETVVKNIVMEYCESQNIFGETQSAYRKHRCTTDNLIKLTQHVSEAFQLSEMVGFVCLDVEKAFDAVWRLGHVHKLNSIGLKNSVIRWINSFLSQRNVFVKINSTVSDSFSPTAGVPQGSVIAPILFLIYVSGLPQIKAQISLFADDFALYYRSRSPKLIEKHLQSSLNSLINWCDSMKIKINPNKTHYLIFKNPSKKESSLELNIKGITIQKTQSIKFLGIIPTPNLKWNEHCKDLIRRANSRLFQLWKLSNLNGNEESLILVYKSWIRPLFLYSNACWLDQSHALIIKYKTFKTEPYEFAFENQDGIRLKTSTKRQT